MAGWTRAYPTILAATRIQQKGTIMSFDETAALLWAAGMLAMVGGGVALHLRGKFPRATATGMRERPLAMALLLALVLVSWPLSVPLLLAWDRFGGGGPDGPVEDQS